MQQDSHEPSAHPQSSSPLFGLPAEVRLLMYEFLFGTGGDDWADAYALSKSDMAIPSECIGSDENVRWDVPSKHVRARYWARHRACFTPIHDFEQRDCTLVCIDGSIHPWPVECEDCRCRTRYSKAVKIHGHELPSRDGIRRLHAGSKLDLSILRTCRLIHREAFLLPFALFTFDAQTDTVASVLVKDVLTAQQAQAIERIHINDMLSHPLEYQALLICFPGLKQLRQSRDGAASVLDGDELQWIDYFRTKRQSKLQSIEVVTGYDIDKSQDRRIGDREAAEGLENYLSNRYYAEAQAQGGMMDGEAVDHVDEALLDRLCKSEHCLKESPRRFLDTNQRPGPTKTTLRGQYSLSAVNDDEEYSDSDDSISEDDEEGQLQRRFRMNFRRFHDEMFRRAHLRGYTPMYKRTDVRVEYHRAR